MAKFKKELLTEKVVVENLKPEFKYISNFKKVDNVTLYSEVSFEQIRKVCFSVDFKFEKMQDDGLKFGEEKLKVELGEEIATMFVNKCDDFFKLSEDSDEMKMEYSTKKFKEYVQEKSAMPDMYNFIERDELNFEKGCFYNIKIKTNFPIADRDYENSKKDLDELFLSLEKELFWMKEIEKQELFKEKINLSEVRFVKNTWNSREQRKVFGIIITVFDEKKEGVIGNYHPFDVNDFIREIN